MSKKSGFCPFLAGGLLGLGIGLLIAPKKGIQLREEIFEKAMDIMTESQGVKEDLSDFIKTFRKEDGEIVERDNDIVISRDFSDRDPHGDISL